jgi:hypothetical protein
MTRVFVCPAVSHPVNYKFLETCTDDYYLEDVRTPDNPFGG